ncbi:S-layer homology domain-containing protein [Saccharibacillus sacchari]|uniref:S-layer homology domain-containing protein n=1 Tax=Saccharibacillus sacchari TaxID=456493 RepID=A0ACC6P6Z6_9BACL
MSNMSECEPTTDKKNTFTLQGGEQKGMKKIVSLALSTAMALSMFASVTSAATLTTQEKYNALVTQGIFAGYPDGNAYLDKDMTRAEFAKVVALLTGLDTSATGTNSYQDQNYANAWYKPYVEAVTKAGYMQGTTTGSVKKFNPNGKVTVQEMAATLVRAAKLEVPTTGINNSASAWAKGEVQAAINAGLISNTANFTAAATRGLLVDTAYSYQTAVVKPAVTSYEVTDNGATVVFTLTNGEKVTVKPTTALQPNVATTVTFTYDGKDYSESVTWKVTSATAATGAAATNLKEIDVTFNGEVDEATASDEDHYSTTAGAIKSAEVLPSGNVVRLTLANGVTMENQESYTVTVTGVQAGTSTINSSALTFRPLDNVLPTVEAVTGLGTKAVKVVFSEPVQTVNSNNFQLDGSAFVGSVTLSANGREAVLRPYTAFTTGAHTLTSSLVTDYAGLKSLSASNEFTVAVDTEAPTVTEIQATLEKAVVTFSEDIDPNTVSRTDFYWINGTTTHYAESIEWLAGNKYAVYFGTNDRLPTYTTNLYVASVSDYSGNVNTVKQFAVTATVDQTRPTVSDVTYNSSATNATVTVKFNRAVTATRDNFVVTNSSGTVQAIQSISGSGTNTIVLDFVNPTLSASTYTLAVTGVRDTTALQNSIAPVSKTFTVSDSARPTVSSVTGNVYNRTIIATFNKAMDPATLSDTTNYLLTLGGNLGTGSVRLPSASNIRIANDYKTVVITLPTTINSTRVEVGTNVTQIAFVGLEDASGNLLQQTGTPFNINANAAATVTAQELTSDNTIELTFSEAVESATASDFTLSRGSVTGVSIDGTTVTLTTSDLGTSTTSPSALTVSVPASNGIATVSGKSVQAFTTATVTDSVAPEIDAPSVGLAYAGRNITVPFTERIVPATGVSVGLLASDFVVKNTATPSAAALTPTTDYTTTVDANGNVVIEILVATPGAQYSVAVKSNAAYVQDAAGNKAAAQGPFVTNTNSAPIQ